MEPEVVFLDLGFATGKDGASKKVTQKYSPTWCFESDCPPYNFNNQELLSLLNYLFQQFAFTVVGHLYPETQPPS